MHWGWYAGVFAVAAADWLAVGLNRPRWRIVTKPGVLLLLIAGFTLASGWRGDGAWFGVGLIFSLAGDIFLMMPPSFFLFSLVYFLIAHIAYIIGLNQSLIVPGWELIIPVVGFIVLGGLFYRRVRSAILCQPKGHWIRFPVLVYLVIISLMVFSSMLCWLRPDWPSTAAGLVSVGALLFYVSDSVLAFTRFCGSIRSGRLLVIVSYHMAQIFIVAGVLFRASKI